MKFPWRHVVVPLLAGLLVTACGGEAPTIEGLSYSRTSIAIGESMTVTWTGTTQGSAKEAVKIVLDPDGTDLSSVKEVTLSPTQTTDYKLVASTPAGETEYPFTVTVDPNRAPVLTITQPTANATLRVDGKLRLGATASDAEDGDVSRRITWSSDKDGALTLDAEGLVSLSVGPHMLTASVTDSGGRMATATVGVTVTALPAATHVVAQGRALHLFAASANELLQRATATIPAEGTLGGHQIFNFVQHPTQPWLYTVSFNDCSGTGDWCWGNARIDRFEVTADSIRYLDAAFLYLASVENLPCAAEESGVEGQVGTCAPIGMAFNADGTRLYVDDDSDDKVHTFAVDATTGHATFIKEQGSTSLHGLALHPDGRYLYNGARTYEVTDDNLTEVADGMVGNSTQVVSLSTGLGLLTTSDTSGVAVFSLADPAAPTEVDSLSFEYENLARDVAANASLTRLVAVGRNQVTTLGFDGSELAVQDALVLSETFTVENRGVALAVDGTQALVTWFKANRDPALRSGGLTVYAIDADGKLTKGSTIEFPEQARVVRPLRLR